MSEKWFEWQVRPGETLQVGDRTLTPLARALVVRFPFGGFVWNRLQVASL